MKRNNGMLLFECFSCKKAIRPLHFFDGSIWCPDCKINLFKELNDRDVKAVESNEDFFALSQELFARYLCGGERAALKNAIAYCRKAAYNFDPYALLNLGYYYGLGYDESVHAETGRAFALLCFELARKYGPTDDADFTGLVDRNLAALQVPIKKVASSDKFYLNALLERMEAADKYVAPRVGVFSVKALGGQPDEEKKEMISLLTKLSSLATVYFLNPSITGRSKDPYTKVKAVNQFNNCLSGEGERWFAYKREGEYLKEYRKELVRAFKDEKELKENMAAISSVIGAAGNKGVDFSDQDIFICTFKGSIYHYYGVEEGKKDSDLDRLSGVYQKVQK